MGENGSLRQTEQVAFRSATAALVQGDVILIVYGYAQTAYNADADQSTPCQPILFLQIISHSIEMDMVQNLIRFKNGIGVNFSHDFLALKLT